MQYFDVEQGSSEWFELRKGVPTASRFDMILTPKQGKPSASADRLIHELIGEKFSLIPPEGVESFTNRAVRWGQQCEAEARHYYAMDRNTDWINGGFCLSDDGRFGASPDFLIGAQYLDGEMRALTTEGAGELKCPQAPTQVEYLLDGGLPDAYKWQVHGHLIVTGAKWVDFLSYSPGLPPLLVRVEPDENTEILRKALDAFWVKYMEALRKIGQGETKR